jgi:hypothetical protein
MDLFNYKGQENANPLDSMSSEDILKAMEAGLMTGMQYDNMLNNGGGLKPESLDYVLKNLENRLDQLVFWNEMPRQKIENTVHQYNQLFKYGQEVGIFNQEGETPTETDSVYRRKSIVVAFTGVTGQVTHPGMIVRTTVGSLYTKEVENKTILLQTILDKKIVDANRQKNPEEFDGVFAQHIEGINDITGGLLGKTSEQVLDAYFGDVAVINANGHVLTDAMVEDAAQAVVNDRNGVIDRIVSSPIVFNNYVKLFHESKRVLVGMAGAVEGATMGQSVNNIVTQFGRVAIKADKFFDFAAPVKIGKGKTSEKAPNAPVADPTTPVAVAVDSKGMFGTENAGTYFYAVTAKNRYGESEPVLLNSTAQAVGATQSVTLKFTGATSSAYPETCYVIYRSEMDPADITTADLFPIFEVSKTELAAGWDGAAAGTVHDRNRWIAGTKSALVYFNGSEMMEYLELGGTMKLDYAIVGPRRSFSVLNYGTPVEYQPGKIARIINIGKRGIPTVTA